MTIQTKLQRLIQNNDVFAIVELEKDLKDQLDEVKAAKEKLFVQALDGAEEKQIGSYIVSYKSTERFALDTEKLIAKYNGDKVKLEKELYSTKLTKPTLRIKKAK